MTIQQEMAQYIGIPYSFRRGPLQIAQESRDGIFKQGINCQSLIHELYRARLGINLPSNLLSKEIYEGTDLFEEISTSDKNLKEGDIFIFGKDMPDADPQDFHLGYYVGETNENNSPLIIHATVYLNNVNIWPLDRFFLYPKYKELKGIRRFSEPLQQ